MFAQLVDAEAAGGDRDDARLIRFGRLDVARRVAEQERLRCREADAVADLRLVPGDLDQMPALAG